MLSLILQLPDRAVEDANHFDPYKASAVRRRQSGCTLQVLSVNRFNWLDFLDAHATSAAGAIFLLVLSFALALRSWATARGEMDVRTDTSSGRFGGQWAYLNNQVHYGSVQSRSLPPSSYLPRTDPSNTSAAPVLPPLYHLNLSRTNLLRTRPTTSIGGHSSVTFPSQPVLIREHSADASAHSRPGIRSPRRRDPNTIMNGNGNGLPPVSAFSIQGILEAIQEDIEGDVDAIAEILGRSRLVLADQHESHLPPQGIIRDNVRPLQAVEEASSSNERLAADNIIILGENDSLVEGSHTGSAAYGLLERLQAIPRIQRQQSEMPQTTIPNPTLLLPRTLSSPAALADHTVDFVHAEQRRRSTRASRSLLNTSNLPALTTPTTHAVVSEVYLSAGANGRTATNPPVVSEAGRHYPLYSYDESELFEDPAVPVPPKPSRLQNILSWEGLAFWMQRSPLEEGRADAERRLREVLERQRQFPLLPEDVVPDTEGDMYD